MNAIHSQAERDAIEDLSVEARAVLNRVIHREVEKAYAAGVAKSAKEMIGMAASAYFAVRPAIDSEAAHLIDLIYASLGEAEERDAPAE